MNIYQFILAFLCAMLFTLSISSLTRVFAYKFPKKFIFFAITCLAASGYIFGQLLVSYPNDPYRVLLFHRIKIFFLLALVPSWFYVVKEMYLPDSSFPRVYLIISVILGLFLPTDLFMSMPITHYHFQAGTVAFDYRFGKTNICYTAYALIQMTFAFYVSFRTFRTRLPMAQKFHASFLLVPLFSGFNDFAVTHGLVHNIMVAEYFISLFIIYTFIMFTLENRRDQNELMEINNSLVRSHVEIKSLQRYLENIIQSMPSMLISIDEDGKITQWNAATERLTGIYAAEILGKNLWKTQALFQKFEQSMREVISSNTPKVFTRQHFDQLDAPDSKFFNVSLYPLASNGIQGGVIRFDDITELEKKDDQLRQMQKMETIGTLASGLAHDFNNVLSGIVGTASIMKFKLDAGREIPPDALKEYVETINEASQRATDMVQQLLALSRRKEQLLAPLDLNLTIKYIMKICANTFDKSVTLKHEYSSEPAMINADHIQVDQVLLNLCVNALHAMTIMRPEGDRQGGELSVSVHRICSDNHFRIAHPEAKDLEYCVLSVQDTGVGMNGKTVAKIFDPFFTTKGEGKGTGLGLAMVYNIIRQHGGFIDVYSEAGRGTTFKVYFPALQCVISEEGLKKEGLITRGKGVVLIVDDEQIMREMMKAMLTECGYEVLDATNGEEGIEIYSRERPRIGLVILDINMPVKSGRETFIEMKSLDEGVKVLLTSGFKKEKVVEELLALGALDFIQKPYTIDRLSDMVARLMSNRDTASMA